jgi:hypothetical protein
MGKRADTFDKTLGDLRTLHGAPLAALLLLATLEQCQVVSMHAVRR